MEIAWPTHYGEDDLIQACVRRERWAQQALYEEYYGKMMGVCLRYSNGEEDALDILHEGFIKVFKNVNKFQPGTSITAWMRRIMVNTAIDFYRKSIRRRTEDIDQAIQLSTDDADTVSMFSKKEIMKAIHKITRGYRNTGRVYIM